MRQTPAAPPAPPPPPPTPIPGVSIEIPGADAIQLTLPTTPEQVQGLRERRDILRDQLERAVSRRQTLLEELQGENGQEIAAEARAGIQGRLNLLDERILQLERDQALTERLISSAAPEVLAQEQQQINALRMAGNRVDEEEAVGMMFGGFGAGILLATLVGKWRRRRASKRLEKAGSTARAVSTDPRIDAMAQSIDAIAEEVERIGEGQRFVTQLLSQRNEQSVLRGAGEPPYRP